MFENLTEKLNGIFGRLTGKGRLTEKDVEEALRQVRMALLEADVNFRVARELVNRVQERAVGSDVMEALSPGQQVVKIIHEELTSILSGGDHKLVQGSRPPTVLMLVGLQGSGKTTTAAKLAFQLRQQGQQPLLIAGDLRRPAAVEQLVTLGKQIGVPVYQEDTSSNAVRVARAGVEQAQRTGAAWAIVDTGGRLHIDDEMMSELEEIKSAVSPQEVLLVADAMTGQDAVTSAQEFHQRVALTGLIMTKMDGDARGGAAISITQVTTVPIKFIGVGERSDALEPFYPDRLASRILGMGDVLSLIDKVQQAVDEKTAKEMEKEDPHRHFRPGGLPGAVSEREKDGHRQYSRDDSGLLPDEETAPRRVRREAASEIRGDNSLHDLGGAAQPRHPERPPPAPHCPGQRHHPPGREPAPQPVPPGAEDHEAAVHRPRPQGPPELVPVTANGPLKGLLYNSQARARGRSRWSVAAAVRTIQRTLSTAPTAGSNWLLRAK